MQVTDSLGLRRTCPCCHAGMLNKGVLALNVPLLGARRFMLTKTLEWNLRWGVLDHMFDETTFCIRPEFVSHPELLEQRLRCKPA